jgi:hypothetical protein
LKIYDGSTPIADFDLDSGANVKKYDNGYLVANLPSVTPELAAKIDAQADDPTDLVSGTVTDQKLPVYALTFTGTVTYKKENPDSAAYAVVLNDSSSGASGVALESAVFGLWAVSARLDGKLSDGNTLEKFYINEVPSINKQTSGASDYTLQSNDAFTGNAVGYAYSFGDNIAEYKESFIYGAAFLKVNGAGDGGSANLNFPEYYSIAFSNLEVSASEMESIANSTAVVSDLGATAKGFGIKHNAPLPYFEDGGEVPHAKLEADFYTHTTKTAETVGNFSVHGENGNGVYGAFGALKN